MSIHLCYIIDDIGPEAGAELQVASLASHLDPTRFEVHVCAFADSHRLRSLAPHCKVAVFPMDSVASVTGMAQLLRVRRYIIDKKIDVVHGFNPKACIVSVLATMGCRHVVTITSRLNTGYWYTPRLVRLFRLLNHYTTRIFANAEHVKRVVMQVERVPASKVDVFFNAVDIERFSCHAAGKDIRASQRPPVVGVVANLRPIKGVDLFLEAAHVVAGTVKDVRFLVVGSGPLRDDLQRLTDRLGLKCRVRFSEASTREAVPQYLHQLSVACLSSRSEGCSNAILEYMATGLPVVATDVGGNSELIEDGITGYIVKERCPEAFAKPIIELLRNEQLRLEMGQRGLERCHRLFSRGRIMKLHEEYYAGLVKASRPLRGRE